MADHTSLLDLFARVLNNGVEHLIRRGLDRDYVSHTEVTAGVRGRIRLADSLKSLTIPQARLCCEFDDFRYDVVHNQIVKSVVVGAHQDDDNGVQSGSAYVFVKPGGGWAGPLTEDAKLTASDAATLDRLGTSVAGSGDIVVVGAVHISAADLHPGSAYVFVKPGGGWAGPPHRGREAHRQRRCWRRPFRRLRGRL